MPRIEQRYQSSFTLHAKKGEGRNLVSCIRAILHEWVIRSENRFYHRQGCYVPKNDFYNRCQIVSTRPGLSRVETSTHYADDLGFAWCMSYDHTDKQPGARWVTECGVRRDADADIVIFSVMLSIRKNGTNRLQSDVRHQYALTVPGFVKNIVGHALVDFVSISGIALPIATTLPAARKGEKFVRTWMYWAKNEEEAQRILEIVNDPRRRFAVVLVMGETSLAKEEIRELATKLCGKTYVCLLSADWKVAQVFKPFNIQFNQVRVILPFYAHGMGRLSQHPIYTLKEDGSHKTARDRVLESQTGYVTYFEDGAIYQLAAIASLNHLTDFRNKSAAFQKAIADKMISDKDAKEMLEYAESIQKDYEIEKQRADSLEKDRDEWRNRVDAKEEECRQRLVSQKARYEGLSRQRHASFTLPDSFPKCVRELQPWMAALPNLDIDAGAWEGMADRDRPDKVELAWKMLWHLNSTMCRIAFEERGQELRFAFKKASGFDYTADENEDVKKKWPEGHRTVVDGRTFMCWRHIKRGNDDKELVRIYFDLDFDRHRIVISWIGRHLRTNLTAAQ